VTVSYYIIIRRRTWFVDGHLGHHCGGSHLWRWIVAEYVLGFELGWLSDRYRRRVGHGGHCCRGHHQRGHGQHSGGGWVSVNLRRVRRRYWMYLGGHSGRVLFLIFRLFVLRVYRFTSFSPTCLSSINHAYLFTDGIVTCASVHRSMVRVVEKDRYLWRFWRRMSQRSDDCNVLTTKATAAIAAAAATTSGRGRDDGTTAFGLTLRRWRPNNPSAAGQRGTAAADDYTRVHHRHHRP